MFRLNEPISMLTDYLVGAFSLGLARRLRDQTRDSDNPAIRAWDGALKSLAAASFFGGTEHGFRPVVGKRGQRLLWKGIMLSLGLTGYHLLRAAIETFVRREHRPALTRLAQVETSAYGAWVTLGDDDYTWGIAQYGIGIAALAAGATPRALKEDRSSQAILAGIGTTVAAAAAEESDLRLGPITGTDIYHILGLVAVYLLYRGARKS